MFLKKYIWLSAATLLTACDLIDYHPYDGRLDSDTSREINPTNIERIEKVCEGKDTIRFIFLWAIPSGVIMRRKISSSTLIN